MSICFLFLFLSVSEAEPLALGSQAKAWEPVKPYFPAQLHSVLLQVADFIYISQPARSLLYQTKELVINTTFGKN